VASGAGQEGGAEAEEEQGRRPAGPGGGSDLLLELLLPPTHAGANCREVMRGGMRETAAGLPPLREENICIPGVFAYARRDTRGDRLRER
jgi:hypothetical protein